MTPKAQRLQFITTLQNAMTDIQALSEVNAQQLAEITVSGGYNLQSNTDIGTLLADLELAIDESISPESYAAITERIKGVSNIASLHGLQEIAKIVGDDIYSALSLSDTLALRYISRVGEDGKRLSDRIWDARDKDYVFQEVFKAIQDGSTRYELAQRIERLVAEGTPARNIRRVAETELSYAYSHAKTDIVLEERDLFPEAEAYVRVKLSPAHPRPDICDLMVGTYKADQAPLPPFHPNCLCITETILRPKTRSVNTTTIDDQIRSGKDELKTVKSIETATGVVNI